MPAGGTQHPSQVPKHATSYSEVQNYRSQNLPRDKTYRGQDSSNLPRTKLTAGQSLPRITAAYRGLLSGKLIGTGYSEKA